MENHENNIKNLEGKIFEFDAILNRSVEKEDKLIELFIEIVEIWENSIKSFLIEVRKISENDIYDPKHFNFKDNLLSPIVEPAEYNDIACEISKSKLILNPWFASPLIGTKDEMCKNLPHYLSIIKKSLINIKNG